MVFDPWLDPNSVECSCGKCQRGGRCSDMRQLHDEHTEGVQRQERVQSLTTEDRAWLEQNGWDGP